MKKILAVLCLVGLGCVPTVRNGGPLLTYEEREDLKVTALRLGAPKDEVTRAWGTPNEYYASGGIVESETLQYGRCASGATTGGIVFITLIKGKLYSWRTARC